MKVRNKNSADSTLEVQMAPLIDCVFLLLIFFLVSTTMKKQEPGVPLQLPTSTTQSYLTTDEGALALSIRADGALYLDGIAISRATMQRKVKEAAQRQPAPTVRIHADHATPYGHVAEVVEYCQFTGLNVIGLRLAPQPDQPEE